MTRRPTHAEACQIAEAFLAEFPDQFGAQDIQTHGKLLIAAVRAFDVIIGASAAPSHQQSIGELLDRAGRILRTAVMDSHDAEPGFHITPGQSAFYTRLLTRLLENVQEHKQ